MAIDKKISKLINEQKRICIKEFDGNIINNKEDLIRLYLERDILMDRSIKECIDSTINKIFISDYHTNIAIYAYIDDLIYEYRMGKKNPKIPEQIAELEEMKNNKDKFNNSIYGQMNQEKYNRIMENIAIYYEDLSKFYNEMSFGELLADGY